ncbi:outer membrane protein assembly factor BamD [Marinobacter halotolerans]|uniref:outer membrane protein assembly factor BamD n=1 Tax=Marinobacter halotolerans TaxID=1569211 RepID=UPI0012478549|nr:outer membrane protein assembly factor BamD [Marinobacter halotolerans]
MIRFGHHSLHRVFGLSLAILFAGVASAQESFRVELGRDGETIGDMRPVFLEFKTQPMPAISPVEVARRYQKLFDNSEEPEVRVDALARLSNIQRLTDKDISVSPEEEQRIYREALSSYEAVLNKGSFHGKLDELLYQMAKAHAFVGQIELSTDRLEQLVGLYPSSELVPEARFRIAERAFATGNYSEAEAQYTRLISGEGRDSLKTKARYMLGWSQYKQGQSAWPRAARSFMTVLGGFSDQTQQFTRVPSADAGLIDDTFRIIALMAAEADGVASINDWSSATGDTSQFSDLLYDRLADLYATRGDYARSVDVNYAFIADHGDHPRAPAFYAQAVEVWRMAGRADRIRDVRADYVAAFSPSNRYQRLSVADQQRWVDFSRRLADYHYDQGESATGSARINHFTAAAEYYDQLAPRKVDAGEVLRLAGDAWLQAGQYAAARVAFRKAAYQAPGYADAADAGWAALVLEREALDGENRLDVSLAQFADEAEKWAATFPADARTPQLSSDLANRLLEQDQFVRARQFAQAAIDHSTSTAAASFSAYLALGETHVAEQSFGLAENAWRKALGMIATGDVSEVSTDEASTLRRQLATSIYRQGEQAAEAGKTDAAVAHFQRIDTVLPGSDIAIKGRYDAANTLLKAKRWLTAVNELTRFRQDFPNHPLTGMVSEKLVFAYLSSDRPIQAADELMTAREGVAPAMETQLRAAELYHQAGATGQRNEIYQAYLGQGDAAVAPTDADTHVLNQTIRQRLVESAISVTRLREQMVSAELDSEWHSEQTLDWAGQAAIALAEIPANRFAAVELRVPLADSLARKQKFLEAARVRYDQAQQFGGEAVVSQATYRRAELYRVLAKDLMASQAPPELNEMEAMQYQMLLEEEAYPFEEKAIALHESNHQRVAEGVFDEWVQQSLDVLATLFPGRYERKVRWMGLNAGNVTGYETGNETESNSNDDA